MTPAERGFSLLMREIHSSTDNEFERAAAARAKRAAQRRLYSYVLPAALMAAAILLSIDGGRNNLGFIPLSPPLAAAVFVRIRWGVTAGRIAVAMALPLVLYVGWNGLMPFEPIWFSGHIAALSALLSSRRRKPHATDKGVGQGERLGVTWDRPPVLFPFGQNLIK